MGIDPATTHSQTQEEIDRCEIVEMARNDYGVRDGELEIDDNAVVSHGEDNGAYVQAWVWVGFGGTRFDKEPTYQSESP
jgi:hypothetical protein